MYSRKYNSTANRSHFQIISHKYKKWEWEYKTQKHVQGLCIIPLCIIGYYYNGRPLYIWISFQWAIRLLPCNGKQRRRWKESIWVSISYSAFELQHLVGTFVFFVNILLIYAETWMHDSLSLSPLPRPPNTNTYNLTTDYISLTKSKQNILANLFL